MLFDSDVLIWHQRGHEGAARAIAEPGMRVVSVVTYMELLQGARDRRDLRAIRTMFTELGIEVLPLSASIGHRASVYVEEHALSSRLDVTDALIAATAVEHGLALCTGNAKHYRPIGELEIRAFRPS